MNRHLSAAMVLALIAWLPAESRAAVRAPKHDCSADSLIEAGPPPALSLLELDYGAFRFPRTLPLKASATDTDLLSVRCKACDGSEAQRPVVDLIDVAVEVYELLGLDGPLFQFPLA